MNPDIITSAPRPEELPPMPPAPRASGSAPSDLRVALDALGRLVRSRAGALRPRRPAIALRPALESAARALILSIASARPLRALEAFVDRRLAIEEASRAASEAAAAAHVLRVRARLSEIEQQLLDDRLADPAIEQALAMILGRPEDEAVEILRRQLGTIDPVVSAASLARQIGAVRGELSTEEYDRMIMRLPHLSADEQASLHTHLSALTPADAAMLLRCYLLRPGRPGPGRH
jgi:hypothetical protein